MATHPELDSEQQHFDRSLARLKELRLRAAATISNAFGHAKVGTHQALFERDVFVANAQRRLDQLLEGTEAIVFGRIDGTDDETNYIGRLGISDSDQNVLVVDWRTPVAEPFYRATGLHPMGLKRRRHYLTQGNKIKDIEDELFGTKSHATDDPGEGLGVPGSAALLSALRRSRTGRMRDIVATVQREQDEIIRAPLDGAIVVNGGPGTGKTAVALHRAAYLLYTHAFPLERQRVLVVGPSRPFLSYISHVLPSLGENGVDMASIGVLCRPVRPTLTDSFDQARLKGDPRMQRLIARAVKLRQRPLKKTASIPMGAGFLHITPEESAQIVGSISRKRGTHNKKRDLLERKLLERLTRRYLNNTLSTTPIEEREVTRAIRGTGEFRLALSRMWPLLTPEQFLSDLWAIPGLVRAAGDGLLSPQECDLLFRPRKVDDPRAASASWSPADLALLDEALDHLGQTKGSQSRLDPAADPELGYRTYGHIVIDETQDLSPMQLRAVARRSLNGSMTIAGDLAQATGAWPVSSWEDITVHLGIKRGYALSQLSTNYRTPREIMVAAGLVLQASGSAGSLPESVREEGRLPRAIRATQDSLSTMALSQASGLISQARGSGADLLRPDGDLSSADFEFDPGLVAIICSPTIVSTILSHAVELGITVGDVAADGISEQISVVTASQSKGLEFDHVIVVEPAEVVRTSSNGLNALFVAMTRATQSLTMLHSLPLPEPIAQSPELIDYQTQI